MMATDPVTERFEQLKNIFLNRGVGKTEASDRAAWLACLNRKERRRFLGHRGPKRGLPKTMRVPKGKP